ncbi:beta-barrel assembly-enhancing protease [Celerinatantimonas yamalensis]|uniref:Putative beta-barrel assembly-enhancing protease n=1 Tax=Celerinatantimonas yamalensis TaxID=559956 RepID=A0ABW9GAX8_9GAMM
MSGSLASCNVLAESTDEQLPEIGTVGAQALTIAQEKQYGDAYMRALRASTPIINDPVLSDFINTLGNRLVAHADNVRFPFHFFLINDPSINAAAFLGGYIKINTGILLVAHNESELASVMAHEISHVTQRHIARSLENAAISNHLTLAGLLGSVILSIADPMAGIAAMQTSMAASIQHRINFTRQNEREADRIGMQVLYRSGFSPTAMVNFFSQLASKYRYSTQPPKWLVDHPLTSERIADAQSRASQYPKKYIAPNLDYQFARARVQVRFGTMDGDQAYSMFKEQLANHSYQLQDAARYGLALALYAQKHYHQAEKLIMQLAQSYPQNMFILDTESDVDLALKQTNKAIKRLESAYQRYPDNNVVIMNLAAAYMDDNAYAKASTLLDYYLREHPNNLLGWQSLAQAYQHQQLNGKAAQALGEYFALRGQYHQAIREMQRAEGKTVNRLDRARITARIDELKDAQKQLKQLQNL